MKPRLHNLLNKRNQSLFYLFLMAPALAVICTGCLAAKAYVDPQFRGATYQSITNSGSPRPVTIGVEFQVNGKHGNPHQQAFVRPKVIRVIAATKVFIEADSASGPQVGQLQISVNDIGNVGAAVGKGLATGLTLGLAGSEVVDGYEMTVTYTPAGGASTVRKYKHAIHTTIGAHAAPKGMESVPLADAFDRVVEEMLLNFFRDTQRDSAS